MFGAQVPNNTQAPVKIDLPTGSKVAPIQIGNITTDQPVMSFSGRSGEKGGSINYDITNGLTFTGPDGQTKSLGGGGGGGVPVWG